MPHGVIDSAKLGGLRPGPASLAALGAAALLAGCSTVPTPAPDAPLPAHWQHTPADTATPHPNYREWWQALHAPGLDRVINQSLQTSPKLKATVERLRAARALYAHSDSPYKPSLSIKTDDPVDPDARSSYFLLGFDSRWELPLFGRASASRKSARGKLAKAAANSREARVSLVAEVARNWIELRAAQQRQRVLAKSLHLQTRRIALQKLRVRLGLASPDSVADARDKRAELQVRQQQAAHAVTAAAQRLAMLTARDSPDPKWLKASAVPSLRGYEPIAVPAELLRTRPDIALARARVISAAGALGIAHANRYPSIGLGAALVASTNLASYHASGLNAIGTFGPVIDIPLFDWGLRAAREHADAHKLKAAVFDYRDAVLTGVADVETRLDALGSTARQLGIRRADWRRQQSTLDHARTRQKLGLASHEQTLAAAGQLDETRLRLIAAERAHDIAYVALYKALGGTTNRLLKTRAN